MITINCGLKCENGQAPTEDNVDAMLRNMQRYAENKYPKLIKISERQYWRQYGGSDFHFAIFWDLEDDGDRAALDDANVPESVGKPEG